MDGALSLLSSHYPPSHLRPTLPSRLPPWPVGPSFVPPHVLLTFVLRVVVPLQPHDCPGEGPELVELLTLAQLHARHQTQRHALHTTHTHTRRKHQPTSTREQLSIHVRPVLWSASGWVGGACLGGDEGGPRLSDVGHGQRRHSAGGQARLVVDGRHGTHQHTHTSVRGANPPGCHGPVGWLVDWLVCVSDPPRNRGAAWPRRPEPRPRTAGTTGLAPAPINQPSTRRRDSSGSREHGCPDVKQGAPPSPWTSPLLACLSERPTDRPTLLCTSLLDLASTEANRLGYCPVAAAPRAGIMAGGRPVGEWGAWPASDEGECTATARQAEGRLSTRTLGGGSW